MKYKDMLGKVRGKKHMARLPHWKPDVWISAKVDGEEIVLSYDDGELFEPTTVEEKSDKWEIINAPSVEDYMKKNHDFARMLVLKVMSSRHSNYIHMLNSRLIDLYIERNALTHKGVGYAISLENGEWIAQFVNNHWIPTLVKANNKDIVNEAIVKYEALLNNIGELNLNLAKVRNQELKIDELIELYYEYK